MLIYLAATALASFLAAALLLLSGTGSPVMAAHFVFALGIMPLIFGAMAHFMPVLTRTGSAPPLIERAPLLLQLAGVSVLLFLSGRAGIAALHGAAGLALAVSLGFAGWFVHRARHTLGRPHPGWRWYLAALLMLACGLMLALAMFLYPPWYHHFRAAHMLLNLMGFIGLTAQGTLHVLLPTVLGGPDPKTPERLQKDLPPAVGGVLAASLGAAFNPYLLALGGALLAYVTARLGLAWLQHYGWQKLATNGAAASLSVALCGFLLCLGVMVAQPLAGLPAISLPQAFVIAFLLPLVSGVLSYLLPVWRYPGRGTPAREACRNRLTRHGGRRALLFVGAAIALLWGADTAAWGLALSGVALFAYALLSSNLLATAR